MPPKIIELLDFKEDDRPDSVTGQVKHGRRRILGLGEDDTMYFWNWYKGEWIPYCHYSAVQEVDE